MPETDKDNLELRCRRCGTCCEKGGPALHEQDMGLIVDGIIPLKNLITLRAGEPVLDNVNGGVFTLESDLVKIRGTGNSPCCIYFNGPEMGCAIYGNRPVECRALNCRDTSAIKEIYLKDRLTRKDLVGNVAGLWDLIEDHQGRCSYEKIGDACDRLKGLSPGQAREDLLEMIKYDIHIRGVMEERSSMDPMIMDFLFGKPLTETLGRFGLSASRDGDRWIIRPA